MARNCDRSCGVRWWWLTVSAGWLLVFTLTVIATHAQRPREASSRPAAIVIEGESLVARASATSGAVSIQSMSSFGNAWSGDAQLFWRAPDANGPARSAPRLTLPVTVPVSGDYVLIVRHTRAPDYGDVRVFVDGNAVGGFSGFAPRVQAARTDIGRISLGSGARTIVLAVAVRPPGSRGSFVGVDRIELQPLRAERMTSGTRDTAVSNVASANNLNHIAVLAPGAKLYRFAHANLDAAPTWSDTGAMDLPFSGKNSASAQFKWDVGAITNASAVAYQVTDGAFTPLVPGQPLQQNGWLRSGFGDGATGQLSIPLPLLPPNVIPPANKSVMMADYQVRIVPLKSLDDKIVTGAASNVIVVRTFANAAPGSNITIKTWTIDPTVDVIKFAWVPQKYTAHWPPGCVAAGDEPSGVGAVIEAVSDAWDFVSTAYADAKNIVADTVVSVIASTTGVEVPKWMVEAAMNAALSAAGVPPNIPNLDKLMSEGAGFLAQQMADQIQIPEEVTEIATKTGVPVDVAIEKYKNDIKAQAQNALLKGAKQAKAAAEGSGGGPCRGLREYEYIRITLRNTGPAVQKNIDVKVEDTAGAFKDLSFKVPSLNPGEEILVPRYLYDPKHLNLPTVNDSQLVSENTDKSWQLWNKKYVGPSFKFTVRVIGYNCASAGQTCMPFTKDEYTTPSRAWGALNGQPFSWP